MSQEITPEFVRGLLENITPGQWESEETEVYSSDCDHHPVIVIDCSCNPTCRMKVECEGNARFIAVAPPIAEAYLKLYEESNEVADRFAKAHTETLLKLVEENKRFREALEWYANGENYYDAPEPAVCRDQGSIASQALSPQTTSDKDVI